MRRMGWRRTPKRAAPDPAHDDSAAKAPHSLAAARYRREIAFEDNVIRIRDTIHSRLHCQAILCRSPVGPAADRYVDKSAGNDTCREPIFVEGGKHVEITRAYRDGKLLEHPDPQDSGSS